MSKKTRLSKQTKTRVRALIKALETSLSPNEHSAIERELNKLAGGNNHAK